MLHNRGASPRAICIPIVLPPRPLFLRWQRSRWTFPRADPRENGFPLCLIRLLLSRRRKILAELLQLYAIVSQGLRIPDFPVRPPFVTLGKISRRGEKKYNYTVPILLSRCWASRSESPFSGRGVFIITRLALNCLLTCNPASEIAFDRKERFVGECRAIGIRRNKGEMIKSLLYKRYPWFNRKSFFVTRKREFFPGATISWTASSYMEAMKVNAYCCTLRYQSRVAKRPRDINRGSVKNEITFLRGQARARAANNFPAHSFAFTS